MVQTVLAFFSLYTNLDDILQDFSLKDFTDLVDGWEVKVVRCKEGEQGWGLFIATKKA